MKVPYIANYLNSTTLVYPSFVYNREKQLSFRDTEMKELLVSPKTNPEIPSGMKLQDSTVLTETLENSDPDEIILFSSTVETRTLERTEPDEIMFGQDSTRTTFTLENSDEDDNPLVFTQDSLVKTATLEQTEPDELTLQDSTRITKSFESTDPDDLLLLS